MTTLVLQAADAAIGGLAGTATAYAGQALTAALAGGPSGSKGPRVVDGPRLTEMNGLSSTEGAPIPRLYGRARIGGQLIWATRFEENANTSVERGASRGGKGFGSPKKASTTVTTSYSYFANLAVGLCEGPIAFVRRIWADGREIDQTRLAIRVHAGTEDQVPDPLIVAKEGADVAPAYRGLAYVVFERLPLAEFGNRVPQFSFEVVRGVDGVRQMIRSVCLIPGSTEFGYDKVPVARDLGFGASASENVHQFQRATNVTASLDWLQAICPNLRHVSLVVSWFGDDLRAGHCTVAPRVEYNSKPTIGGEWSAAGLSRAAAREVSRVDGRPAYGGTPSDDGLIRLIGELKARGLAVTLYPFTMMDIEAGNALPDPRTGEDGQPPYPWRGRITCDPAPGVAGSVDGTAEAAAQVASFFGSGSWTFRHLVLHCAGLAVAAGGVDGFVIGSELVGLTRVRSAPGTYPAVAALRALAAEARAVLGAETKIVYAADWTEYGAHVLGGGDEVRFPLDPLWADPNIDAVGIDYYPPISDWRDGPDNADAALGRSVHDVDYLRGRLGAGEAFDWYYADEAARLAQSRTPITDGTYAKPWIYRAKDLVGWWSNAHVERVGGTETAATAWVPGSKPIWLTEIGVPAVDKGPNGPNVFPDPKSSESALPPLSRGLRDDLVQVRALEAVLTRFDPALSGHQPAFNPASPVFSGRMIDPDRISVWAWDARPFPAFPDLDLVWADGANWATGHWITGRIEGAPLDRLVAALLRDYGLTPAADIPLDGFVDGYVLDRRMSARSALQPLEQLFGFDAIAAVGGIVWRGRGGRVDAALGPADLCASGDDPVLVRSRAQETDLPASIELGFTDGEGEYPRAAVGSRRLAGSSRREEAHDLAVVTRRADAQRLADIWLQDAWAGRDIAEFSLSPRRVDLEPGDVIELADASGVALHRITRIVDGATRRVSTRAVEPAIFVGFPRAGAPPRRPPAAPAISGRPEVVILDLAATPSDPPPLQYLAAAAEPWPGALAVWRRAGSEPFALVATATVPAVIGRTLGPVPPGPTSVWDRGTAFEVIVSSAALSSVSETGALAGGNLFALRGEGGWEILSAASAEMIGARSYRLSDCLRGLGGTEALAARLVPAGATIVLLDEAVVPLSTTLADLGRTFIYRIGSADRDHADPSYVELNAAVADLALKPLAPTGHCARRESEGIRLSWIRRTRRDGDNWELAEVPLGEAVERYLVDVLDGASVKRTWETSEPGLLYAAADELADLGSSQASLTLRVAQLSAVAGPGFARTVTIPILPE